MIEFMIKHDSSRDCRIQFAETFGRIFSRKGVYKIMEKWDKKCAIEEFHRGNGGRTIRLGTIRPEKKRKKPNLTYTNLT